MITPQMATRYRDRKHIPHGAPFDEKVTAEELQDLWAHGVIHMVSENGETKYKWNGDHTHQQTFARMQRQQRTRTHKRREEHDPDEEDD